MNTENGMNELHAILGSLSTQCVKDAQSCSDQVSQQYNALGHGPRLNMIAYDDLA